MKPVWLVSLLLMNVLWAAAYACFKLLAPVLDPGALATLRFGLAAVVLLGMWPWIAGTGPRGADLVRTAFLGVVVFCLAPRLQIAGVQLGRAGDAAVLVAFDPVIASVAAALFLGERVPGRRWAGFGLGFLGVVLLAEPWRPDFAWTGLRASLLILLSYACEAAYSVIGKPLLRQSSPLKVLAAGLMFGTASNLVFDAAGLVAAVPRLSSGDWAAVGYLVLICTVAGYALWFYAVRETPVNAVTMTIFMQPVAGVLFALVLVGEPLRWSQLAGGLVIAAGLLMSLSVASWVGMFRRTPG